MPPSLCTIIVSGILATQPVLAGSRAWESSIVYKPLNNAGGLLESITSNTTDNNGLRTAESLAKRWVTINAGEEKANDHLWPDGKILYCYESAQTKDLFSKDLVEARILWQNSGLGENFKWEEQDSKFCNDAANRPKFLLIVKGDGLSCTVGVPPLDKMNGDRGPLMRLSADLKIGKQNLVANFAHQMGHAWGLHHEHQNPAWWSSDYAASGGKIFSASNFKCEKLADYESVSKKLTADQMKKACTSRAFAQTYQFSAAEYLPIIDSNAYRAGSSVGEPDWDSIMFYGTGDSEVLTKLNGDAIKQNIAPSQQDVAGLKELYGVLTTPKFNPLGSKSSTKLSKFKEIRKKDKDSGCGEAEDDGPDDTPTASSSFVPTATATADCSALVDEQERSSTDESVEKRRMKDALHRRRIEKRAPKSGIACSGDSNSNSADRWKISSFNYPASGKDFDAVTYGWDTPQSCDNYDWGHAHYKVDTYDTEHVLEWSVITNFFTTVNTAYATDHFVSPDPNEQGKKINFCQYWRKSWDFEDGMYIDNPAPQAVSASTVLKRVPIDWIAAAYPYRHIKQGGEAFLDELVLLQIHINTPAKNNMFSDNQIHDDTKMKALIERTSSVIAVNSPRIALQNMRYVIGVFKYMQEPAIAKIFKDEKIRIGAVIDGIDRELPRTPRRVTQSSPRTFTPWQTLGLGAKWDAYMDEVFAKAKDKGTKFVDDNLKRLNDEYMSQAAKDKAKDDPTKTPAQRNEIAEWAKLRNDIDGYIVALEAEWTKSKNWVKPW